RVQAAEAVQAVVVRPSLAHGGPPRRGALLTRGPGGDKAPPGRAIITGHHQRMQGAALKNTSFAAGGGSRGTLGPTASSRLTSCRVGGAASSRSRKSAPSSAYVVPRFSTW